MTDATPMPDPVAQALIELRHPARLLAEALAATRAAQITGREIDTSPVEDDESGERPNAHFDRLDRHRRLLDESLNLINIAKAAAELRAGRPLDDAEFDGDEPDTELRTVPPFDLIRREDPRPVNGVRFTATIEGRYLGSVGGREWLWHSLGGFLDVSSAFSVSVPDADNLSNVTLSGHVRSIAGEQALCVTDGGDSVILPWAMLKTSPDE